MTQLGMTEDVAYSPARHHLSTAADIAAGVGDTIAASNLLAGIQNGEVNLTDIPVSLDDIERVAGRKLGDPIA